MTKKIYYIGFYDMVGAKHNRNYMLAATTKMDYIASAIVRGGNSVEIISSSWVNENKYKFIRGEKREVADNITLQTMPSFGARTKVGRGIRVYFTLVALFLRLLLIKKSETVLVYHTPWLSLPVRAAKWIKRFRLILEVEEIYTYAFNLKPSTLKAELKLINSADAWILVNDLIGDILELDKCKSIVCYGQYKVINDSTTTKKFDDDKVHLVYAGSLGNYKGGAQNAIEAARYLSEKYFLHILGAAQGKFLADLLEEISEINSLSACKVKYEGCMTGSDYATFMKGCDIGLNPQDWGDYMLYAYPSKTLSYLCFGLNVVTSPLKTLKVSKINSLFNYTPYETPESIASAIIDANLFSKEEIAAKIEEMHAEFICDLKIIIN